MPFQVVSSDVDPESEGEGLLGQPAFSSVLTVMEGTVKHSESLDQSRALPTVSREEMHTTQWPSRSSSQGSNESSSSSFVGDSFRASSGLIFSMSQKTTTPAQVNWFSVSRPSHTSFFKDGKEDLSSFPFSSLTSMSSSAAATSNVPSSRLSLLFLSSTEQINKAVSSEGQGTVSSLAFQAETAAFSSAGPQGWTNSLTTAEPTPPTVPDLHAVTPGTQHATSKPANFLSEANTETSNKTTKHFLYSLVEKIPEKFINGTSRNILSSAKTSTNILYATPNNSVNPSDNLYVPTQAQNKSLNSVFDYNLESSYLFLFNQESQAVQRQQGASQNPTSALPSARAKGYSLSSHVTQQMLQRTAHIIQNEEKTAADTNNLAHKSNAADPSVTPAMAFTPSRVFLTVSSSDQTLLSQTAVAKLARTHPSTESSEHASNPGDLLTAAGHSSPRLPAININHNQSEITGAELKSASSQAHSDDSLPLTQLRPESGSVRLSAEAERPLSTSESDGPKDVREFATQTEAVKDATHRGWAALKTIFAPNSRTESPSDPTESMRYETEHQSSLNLTQPSCLPPSNSNHDPKEDSASIFFSKEVELGTRMSSLESLLQTRSSFSFLHSFSTPASLSEKPAESAGSSAGTSAPTKLQGTAEFQTKLSDSGTSDVTYRNEPSAHFHTNTVRGYNSPFFSRNEASSAIHKTGDASEQLTAHLPTFTTSENLFVLNDASESSDKQSSAKPLPHKAFADALALVRSTNRDHYVTFSPLSESENTPTQKTNVSLLGLITGVSGDNSNSFLGRQTVSSAVTSSFRDGLKSAQTPSAIFGRFGTKLMTLYTKRKATKPRPLQSSAFKSENASSGFDSAQSNLSADGSSYEHQKLEDRQEHNVDILNSDDSTSVTSDPYPTYPTVGEDPYITSVKGTSNDKEGSTDSPPAYLRSAVAAGALPEVATSAGASDVSLLLSYITAYPETSSQANSLALAFEGERTAPVVDLQSAESTVAHPDVTTAQKRSVSQNDVSPPSLFRSSSPSVTFSSPSSSFPQLSSLFMKPFTSLSYSDYILSKRPTVHPSPSSVSVEPTFSLSSLTLPSSLDYDGSLQVTGTFVLTEPGIDDLTTGTSLSAVFPFPKDKEAGLKPSQTDGVLLSADSTVGTSQVSPMTPQQVTTSSSVKLSTTTLASATNPPTTSTPSVKVTTHLTPTTTPQRTLITRRTTTTTTIRAYTSRRTFTSPIQRTSPQRGVTTVFVSPFTTTTEPPPPQCNITESLWVKTGQQSF